VLNQVPRHEDVFWSGGITSHIISFDTRWKWVVNFTPRPLLPSGKELLVLYG